MRGYAMVNGLDCRCSRTSMPIGDTDVALTIREGEDEVRCCAGE